MDGLKTRSLQLWQALNIFQIGYMQYVCCISFESQNFAETDEVKEGCYLATVICKRFCLGLHGFAASLHVFTLLSGRCCCGCSIFDGLMGAPGHPFCDILGSGGCLVKCAKKGTQMETHMEPLGCIV